jgi:hypothetical protein
MFIVIAFAKQFFGKLNFRAQSYDIFIKKHQMAT